MTDFIYWLGDFFFTIFKPLEWLGETPYFNLNVAFIILGFIGLFVWLKMQAKFNKEAEEKGTLK
ncbi:MAG: hypothetical protein OQJ96_03785 [Flavobacteriales bacterium]|nr:hypothetical protein [Flavobacteriales bacterium]MCW8912479.1 hypothetical protein [Flavobacteriales bacterium]MCW8936563.1 hypothetical protein [Flavobacteriales bacterium]MCW8940948.1 hypothetical protein [Flavobacteriales bacterium]MCW8968002.1 hypothetical protein [Flavobacteriales bacterium]